MEWIKPVCVGIIVILLFWWMLNLIIYAYAPDPNGCSFGWLKKHHWDIESEDRTYSGYVSWTNHIDWKCKKCGKTERVDCQKHVKY